MTPHQLTKTEDEISSLWNAGELNSLVHLCGSSDGSYEEWLCDFFRSNIKPTDWILASHRAHFQYLLHGGLDLIEKVKVGKSMFCYNERFIQSAIVAGTCSIAVGLALSIKARGGTEKVWNFIGDGAADHGHALEAIKAAHGMDLPLTFIIEDNDSSCGVKKEQRGSPEKWPWPSNVIYHRYSPRFPHAGTGEKITLKRQAP